MAQALTQLLQGQELSPVSGRKPSKGFKDKDPRGICKMESGKLGRRKIRYD